MSSPNQPNIPLIQTICDDPWKAVVKVVAYYNAATNTSNTVIQANALFGANNANNAPLPILSVSRVLYSAGLANGYVEISWVGNNGGANNPLLILGSRTSGDMPQYINNPLAASNTSNVALSNTTGDIAVTVTGAEPFDSYSLILTVNKENSQGGWANAFVNYNASDFH
jgi:hypothetical protein